MSMEAYLAEIKDEKDPLLTELNTLAMRKRISRLDKLRAETLKELRKLAGRADLGVEKFLGDAYRDNYYKSLYDIGQKASILSSVAEVDSEKLKEVLSAPWSGKNYSQRLWKNTDKLSQLIKQEITDGIHRGTSLQKLASLIRRRMDVGQYEAMRLVRTEMNYAQNHAALDSVKDSGMKYYTFIATLDKRTSAICRAHDRKTYPASEAQPGKNMPPLHPHCRSTISGSLKSTGRTKGTRTGKDAEGNRITVPANMVYEDFYKVYIEKSITLKDWQSLIKDDILSLGSDNGLEQAKKRDHKIMITDIAIKKVPLIKTKGMTSELAKIIQLEHQSLLQLAKDENDSNEVLSVLSLAESNLNKIVGAKIKGNEFGVNPSISCNARAIFLKNNGIRDSLAYLHNHPSTNNFSLPDIMSFIQDGRIGIITVVTNQGTVYILQKDNRYNYTWIRDLFSNVFESYKAGVLPHNEAVQEFLKQCFKGGIIYERSK